MDIDAEITSKSKPTVEGKGIKMASVKKNFIYNSAYQILQILLPLVTTPYVSRVLGPEAIGTFSYNYAIAVVFVMFSMLGLSNYGNRTIAEHKDTPDELRKSFWGIYSMQLFSSVVVMFAYIVYVVCINRSIFAAVMLIHIISAIFDVSWLFFGLEKFKYTTIRSVAVKIIMTLLIFILVKSKDDLLIYSIIICLSSLFSQLALWPYVMKNIKPVKVLSGQIIRHVKPNLILFIPVIAIGIYRYMDKVMLGAITTSIEVGYYESSDKIINVPMALIISLGTVMLPRIANLISNKKRKLADRYIEKSIYFVMFLSSSLCFGIMAIAKAFVPLFYGDGFDKCINLFYILMPSCLFLAFANVIRTQYLIPAKKDKIYVTSVIIGAVVNLIANAIFIPNLESVGAAVGTFLAQAVVCVYQAYKVKDDLRVKRYFFKSVPFVISGVVMFVVLYIINEFAHVFFALQIIYNIILGAIIYLLTLITIVKVFKLDYDICPQKNSNQRR